jgi:hypothetical protein
MYILSIEENLHKSKKLLKSNLRGELTEVNETKFSLKEKSFVLHVSKAITEHPNQGDIKEIRNVLLPILLCSLAQKGSSFI